MHFSILNFLFKAVINEDTQGNVKQLQSEVKKLKEQLALLNSGQSLQDASLPTGKAYPLPPPLKLVFQDDLFKPSICFPFKKPLKVLKNKT